MTVVHYYGGEGAVPDNAIVHPSKAHSARPASQNAVRHDNSFARLVLRQRTAVCAQDDGVVTRLDYAVRDCDVTGAVHVNSVVVWVAHGGEYLQAVNLHSVAVMYPVSPSRRLVDHGNIAYPDIAAPRQEHNARERLVQWQYTFVCPAVPARLVRRLDVVLPVAVYDAAAGDGYPLSLVREDETCIPPAREVLALDVPDLLPVGEVLNVGRGKKPRRTVDVQFHAAAKLDCAAKERAPGKCYLASTRLHALVDGRLNGRRVLRHSVALRAEIAHIKRAVHRKCDQRRHQCCSAKQSRLHHLRPPAASSCAWSSHENHHACMRLCRQDAVDDICLPYCRRLSINGDCPVIKVLRPAKRPGGRDKARAR